MSQHLKRIAAPKNWTINRKQNTFTTKPKPGAYAQQASLPLVIVLRDLLHHADTAAEVAKLLQTQMVLVDGIRRKDLHLGVGLFDVISLPSAQKHYRVVLDTKGRLALREISLAEAHLKLGKIVGKTMLTGGKAQYHLHDGKNIVAATQARVGDTFVLSLPASDTIQFGVKEVLPLKPGMLVFLVRGKHSGDLGTLNRAAGKEASYVLGQKEVETAKEYLFVVGDKKPRITLA